MPHVQFIDLQQNSLCLSSIFSHRYCNVAVLILTVKGWYFYILCWQRLLVRLLKMKMHFGKYIKPKGCLSLKASIKVVCIKSIRRASLQVNEMILRLAFALSRETGLCLLRQNITESESIRARLPGKEKKNTVCKFCNITTNMGR